MGQLLRIGHLHCSIVPAMVSDLQVKTSPRPRSRLALEVLIPAERCQRSYDKAIRKLCRTVRLPGFRPGRVPRTAVLQQLGTRHVWITALEQLLEDTAQEVMDNQDLDLLGKLQLQDSFGDLAQQFNPAESMTLNMEADVRPDATFKTYRNLEVEVEEVSVEGMVADVLQQQRRSASKLVPLEKTVAESGDVAMIRLVVPPGDAPDGEPSTESDSRTLEVDLVEKDGLMPKLVPVILGMTVGETRPVPDDADAGESDGETGSPPEQDLEQDVDQDEGRSAASISLCELKARQLPELDDAFAQKVSKFSTMAELKDALGQEMESQVRKRNKDSRQDALLDVLCEHMAVELPESLVEQEMDTVTEEYKTELRARGLNPDLLLNDNGTLPSQLEQIKLDEAQRRAQRKVALETVAKAEQLTVAEAALDEQVQALRKGLNTRQARQLNSTKLRALVKRGLLREKALAWLEEHNTFKVRTTTVEDGEETQGSPAPAVDLTESIPD